MLFPGEEGRRGLSKAADGHHGRNHQEALWGEPSIDRGLLVTDDQHTYRSGPSPEEGVQVRK